MTATLLNHNALQHVEAGIEANRSEAAGLIPAIMEGDIEAGTRLNALNLAWGQLEEARAQLTGEPFAPYRMGR